MIPYLIAGGFITTLHLIANHYVIPSGNKIRLDFEHRYTDTYADKGKTKDLHMFIGPDTKVYIRFYSKSDTSARDFRLERFKDGKLVYLLKARRAKWAGEPNHWQLSNFETRTFNGMKETFVQGGSEKKDTTLSLYPKDFVRYHNQKEMMTTGELQDFINMERQRGLAPTKIFEIEIHRRTAEPISIIILTLIGMSIAARKVRGGIGFHLAMGVGIGAVFIFLSKFAITFATNKALSPLMGVWIPNIIFSVVAAYLILKAQK
jgi:lipopolysaccharide export system permease protein